MAKDPICGMVVPRATALWADPGGRRYWFCSEGCRRSFLDPERELSQMRRRMGIAISGVLLAPLPWMTWGVWLFVLTTPVQFIGGWGFYRGAWAALWSRSLNMDVLIAPGTSVAYGYSVLVVFAPHWLPVAVDQRDVHFEVAAVVIAFVLIGKVMEESIKKRCTQRERLRRWWAMG